MSTFPVGATGEGEGISGTTPAVATPCSTDTKAWMVAYDMPSAPRHVYGGGPTDYPPPP